MIQMQTSLEVADNSGARRVEMIMPIGGSTGKIASLGDRIKVTVKEASPDGTIKKGTVQDAVIVRTRKEVRRADGTYVRFDQNAAVLIKEDGTPIGEVCRKAGISDATFYNWRKKYAGLMPSEMKRLKLLEEENARLKKLVADLSLDKAMLQDVVKRKL